MLSENSFLNKNKYRLLTGIILFSTALIRLRLLSFPLERDEGEFAYMGQLILQGYPPYSEAANMKLPGTYYMYALIMALFGQTTEAIHFGLLFVNLACIFLVYKIAKKLFNDFAAVFACGTYALMSTNISVLGFAAHATHFVILFALMGTWLLLKAESSKRYFYIFLSGLVFGFAFIMKQHGLIFVPFAGLYIGWLHLNGKQNNYIAAIRDNALLGLGTVLPFILTLIYIYKKSNFEKFYYWVFQYSHTPSIIQTGNVLNVFLQAIGHVADKFALLWLIAAAGGIMLYLSNIEQKKKIFLWLFAIFSFLTLVPGFHFRPHYFITFLPAVAILAGFGFYYFRESLKSVFILPQVGSLLTGVIFIGITGAGIFFQRGYFLTEPVNELSRKAFDIAPFPETILISDYIKTKTGNEDKIFVFGNEPQVYFYTKRMAATSFMYFYPLMEKHEYKFSMQKEMIAEVEAAQPKMILVTQAVSWDVRPYSERYIFKWFDEYVNKYYRLEGVIDVLREKPSVYKWGDSAAAYIPQSEDFMILLTLDKEKDANDTLAYQIDRLFYNIENRFVGYEP